MTARGDLDAALAMAREAVPLCREDGYVDWLFPHLALRVAKAGRSEDAARLWGYADRIAESGTTWQINSQNALDALAALLAQVMDSARIDMLMAAGRHLGEEEAVALALA
ncbi:MAG: hypothetical protein WDN69_23410 [Aliidongia sp.]